MASLNKTKHSLPLVIWILALLLALTCTGCAGPADDSASEPPVPAEESSQPAETEEPEEPAAPNPTGPADFNLDTVEPYDSEPTCAVNGDAPYFEESDLTLDAREQFSRFDAQGRCGTAVALVGEETMPTEERGPIGEVRPSGWQISKYDWIDGKYLFNRCHLIGYQLTGQNANELNLITGTRYMNVEGMQPFENRVASFVRETGSHVLDRVTPVLAGENLVASGVLMEAESVEDSGEGLRFCRWCYNVEPGVAIDYANGDNRSDGTMEEAQESKELSEYDYILNTNSWKFHRPDCPSVDDMAEHNKKGFNGTRDEAIELGYQPCGSCKP